MAITSPGWARSTAFWIVFSGRSMVPGAVSLPLAATINVEAAAAGGAATAATEAVAATVAPDTKIASTVLFRMWRAPHRVRALPGWKALSLYRRTVTRPARARQAHGAGPAARAGRRRAGTVKSFS